VAQPSPAVTAKALRLIEQNRVMFTQTAGKAVATVAGDHGHYEVGFDARRWWCSCENPKQTCAHILACKYLLRAFDVKTD
jgi:hypothetical protein